MIGCVVCNQEEGYCEFCPPADPFHPALSDPDEPFVPLAMFAPTEPNFDHPFENDRGTIPERKVTTVIVNNDPGDENDARPRRRFDDVEGITLVPYKATYRLGETFFTRKITGFDSFAASAAVATAACREGETLYSLEVAA